MFEKQFQEICKSEIKGAKSGSLACHINIATLLPYRKNDKGTIDCTFSRRNHALVYIGSFNKKNSHEVYNLNLEWCGVTSCRQVLSQESVVSQMGALHAALYPMLDDRKKQSIVYVILEL